MSTQNIMESNNAIEHLEMYVKNRVAVDVFKQNRSFLVTFTPED